MSSLLRILKAFMVTLLVAHGLTVCNYGRGNTTVTFAILSGRLVGFHTPQTRRPAISATPALRLASRSSGWLHFDSVPFESTFMAHRRNTSENMYPFCFQVHNIVKGEAYNVKPRNSGRSRPRTWTGGATPSRRIGPRTLHLQKG